MLISHLFYISSRGLWGLCSSTLGLKMMRTPAPCNFSPPYPECVATLVAAVGNCGKSEGQFSWGSVSPGGEEKWLQIKLELLDNPTERFALGSPSLYSLSWHLVLLEVPWFA